MQTLLQTSDASHRPSSSQPQPPASTGTPETDVVSLSKGSAGTGAGTAKRSMTRNNVLDEDGARISHHGGKHSTEELEAQHARRAERGKDRNPNSRQNTNANAARHASQ